MSVLFHDIHEDVDRKIDNHGLDHFNWWELIYADDTMLVGHRARELNILIKAIENASDKYNLKLNYGKCNYIAMNGKAHIHFSDGKTYETSRQSHVSRRGNYDRCGKMERIEQQNEHCTQNMQQIKNFLV